jgi:ATP-binding cassette subfamily F protein 3
MSGKSNNTRAVLKANLPSIDDDTLDYFESMIESGESITKESMKETLAPFIESYGLAQDLESAEKICEDIVSQMEGLVTVVSSDADMPMLLEKAVVLNDVTKSHLSAEEKATVDTLWGFENVRKKRNTVMEVTDVASSKDERKAAKEQRKWLEDLESQFVGEEDNNKVSTMMIPDFSEGTKEKDIHVHNFNITYGGKILLEEADLRLVYGRKYGLIGRNGIGKTTLLKHMANFDIEGFPKHHRVLHVKQEVKSSASSVLQVVLESDVERNTLLAKEKELQNQLGEENGGSAAIDKIMQQLEEVNERLNIIGAHSAEGRAASILSGLQFTDEMQAASTDSLSGGWRMRVAIAAALFIEPDLLMLDEPTNHLDLEAVLWLEKYLKGYEKTVLLVSHDRAFLNEVCTDIILFDKLKLSYYRGNYDMYEGTRKEMQVVQQKQHEAQQVKLQHMQEFVDKFRYNAKRASLVQSRIKALEKETVIEAVEEETEFKFSFYDAGQLGRPIIQIEGVTFGYPNAKGEKIEPLFKNVHLGIDQSSRVALVGPNGAGKVSLAKQQQSV